MIRMKSILTETSFTGKTYISVDIQPEYQKSFGFDINDFTEFLNQGEFGKLIFLYNGAETLGMVSEDDYKMWLIDSGLSEDTLYNAHFYDKGYAFFRYCMDNSIDDSAVANFVRFMYENDVRDSRDMTREMWAKYLREYRRFDRKEVYSLLQAAGDCVHIPDLMDYLKKMRNIVLTGGGVNECLKEVEIALQALKIPYTVDSRFTY
jgi:hypothetical protein